MVINMITIDREKLVGIFSKDADTKNRASVYLEEIINEGLQNKDFSLKKSLHIKFEKKVKGEYIPVNTNQRQAIAQRIINEINTFEDVKAKIRGNFKYGTQESVEEALRKNPYMVIKDAISKVNNSTYFQKDYGKVPMVKDHKLVRGKYDYASREYYQNKSFYENIIKGNGLSQRFQELTNTGVELQKSANGKFLIKSKRKYNIDYNEFHYLGAKLEKTVIDENGEMHIVKGYVTKYIGHDTEVYIIEWQSKGGSFDYGVQIGEANDYYALEEQYKPSNFTKKEYNWRK